MSDLREIEVFLVVAEELHFGNTARRLFISQSSVSELVSSLEKRLGGKLFERTSRRVELTQLGTMFRAEVAPAFRALRSAIAQAQQTALGGKERIRIGFLGGGLYELTGPIVNRFRQLMPDTELELVELTYSEQATAVLENSVDLAFCRAPIAVPGLVAGVPFMPDQRVLAVPTGHRLAGQLLVDPEELAHENLIKVPDIPGLEQWRETHTPSRTPQGTTIPPGPTVNSVREAMVAVLSGRGVHTMMERAIAYYTTHGVCFVPLDLPKVTTISLRRENETRESVLCLERIAPEVAAEAERGGHLSI